jgi:hypothetical protein
MTMLYLADRCTPENAPTFVKVVPLAPFGMFLGRPLSPPLDEVKVQVTSLNHIPDMWWIGPYFAVSDRVLRTINDSGETHFELFPMSVTAKKHDLRGAMFVVNLLDNVPCLDRDASCFSVDEDGFIDNISRLVIDEGRVPEGRTLFRLAEKADLILARSKLVEPLQQLAVRGVRFIPVETSATTG